MIFLQLFNVSSLWMKVRVKQRCTHDAVPIELGIRQKLQFTRIQINLVVPYNINLCHHMHLCSSHAHLTQTFKVFYRIYLHRLLFPYIPAGVVPFLETCGPLYTWLSTMTVIFQWRRIHTNSNNKELGIRLTRFLSQLGSFTYIHTKVESWFKVSCERGRELGVFIANIFTRCIWTKHINFIVLVHLM